MLTQNIIKKEFALSGSEQNPDLTGKDWLDDVETRDQQGRARAGRGVQAEAASISWCVDNLADLVAGMNALSGDNLLKLDHIKLQIEARDRAIANPFVKDTQVMNIHNARKYIGDKLIRTAKPHRILDPACGPLIAVRLNILTRKTLGGFETDLDGRVFGQDGQIMPGLYAVGEAAGFGGGGDAWLPLAGRHLPRRLSCFSGRNAGRATAKAVG